MCCKDLLGVDLPGHSIRYFLGALEPSWQDPELEEKGAMTQAFFSRDLGKFGRLRV